eukprot:Hpha_TRINITY_DN34196_c0_g1::TRINITY_DN34196_c0_g1_i1::g.75958::m.75958
MGCDAAPTVIVLDSDGDESPTAQRTAQADQTQAPPASVSEELHLVSWNVAGWDTTLRGITERCGLPDWMLRHHVDVLCLQEVKLSTATLSNPRSQTGATLEGFETFWACADGPRTRDGGQGKGLNGVATFARKGTVRAADAAPLKDPELDREGRCVMTDHGEFCVFNVYVPNSSSGSKRLPFRMRFMTRLREAMKRRRDRGQAVVLCGDLNVAPRAVDICWLSRRIFPDKIFSDPSPPPEVRELHDAVAGCWPDVRKRMLGAEVKTEVVNLSSQQGATLEKYRAVAERSDGVRVRLGKPQFSAADAVVRMEGREVEGLEVTPPGALSVDTVMDGIEKLAHTEASRLTQQHWRALANAYGEAPYAPAVLQWHSDILADGMVDTFTEAHPRAESRFTAWSQYFNRRFYNQGGRIDSFIVDRGLWERRGRVGGSLSTGGTETDPNSDQAALAAVTARGMFKPAPLTGGGIPPCPHAAFELQFRDAPHTGILYPPPEASDHIPVTLLLHTPELRANKLQLLDDTSTKRAQPHKKQSTITSFFAPSSKRQRTLKKGT